MDTSHQHANTDNRLILTVNQRLALTLQRQHDQQQSTLHSTWAQANIQPLTRWLTTLWQQHSHHGYLLSAWQEQQLWLDLIQTDDSVITLNPLKTAKLAQQAHVLLCQWQLTLEESDQLNDDIRHFRSWQRRFVTHTATEDFITRHQLPARVGTLLQTTPLTLPRVIDLIGFDTLPPNIADLITQLRAVTTVNLVPAEAQATSIQSYHAANEQEERIAMAQWAKQQVDAGKHVGIVHVQLSQQRDHIADALESTLPAQFNLSAGKPLLHYEILQVACEALAIGCHDIAVNSLYQWLQSPYVNHSDHDIASAACLDEAIRQQQAHRITFLTLNAQANTASATSSWPDRLTAFSAVKSPLPNKQTPRAWANSFTQLLHAIGWPGKRTLNSLEHQLMTQMTQALTALASLTMVATEINYAEALRLLRTYLKDTVFQAEGSNAPVQVLGMLESSGLSFDALWVAGLDSGAWPPTAKPNPFIPSELQKQHQLPHSSAERELQFSRTIMERLEHAAPHVVLSWPQCRDDQTLHPSPLIPADALAAPYLANMNHTPWQDQPLAVDRMDDAAAPKINADETVRGGSAILEQQAACPFKAFSTFRLNARPLAEPQHGLNALTRGILVHRVLETLWSSLGTQSQWLALNELDRNRRIDHHIDCALQEYPQLNTIPTFYIELERQRLQHLITDWMQLEASRPPFSVLSQESEHRIAIDSLDLTLKIDRIDQTKDGQRVLIDYKTGETAIGGWFGERLSAPQLPLYCAFTQTAPTAAISFAEVRTQQCRFNGIATESSATIADGVIAVNTLSSLPDTRWDTLTTQWKASIRQVAHEFTQGHAAVTPYTTSACQYCDLHALCRIAL